MGWGLAFGLFGLPFSPSSLSSFFSRSLTLISFPRQTSFAIENGYPQCMLCDGHCLNFLCSFDIRIHCFLLPNQMQIQASSDFICYLNWTGAFSWSFFVVTFFIGLISWYHLYAQWEDQTYCISFFIVGIWLSMTLNSKKKTFIE